MNHLSTGWAFWFLDTFVEVLFLHTVTISAYLVHLLSLFSSVPCVDEFRSKKPKMGLDGAGK